jgi:hypothetical protein
MDSLFAKMRRLHERGPRSRGLAVDAEGVALGPDCVLVQRTPVGYRAMEAAHIAAIQKYVFDGDGRLGRLPTVHAAIARALDSKDLVKAQLLALAIPIDALDDRRLARLALASAALRKDFNPDEPRNDHGRWTTGDQAPADERDTPVSGLVQTPARLPEPPSFLGKLSPVIERGLLELAARLATAAVVFRILFIPDNQSLIVEGDVPGHPDLKYHYDKDKGELSVYTGDDWRKPQLSGQADKDGIFVDSNGRPFGRKLKNGTVIVDLDTAGPATDNARPTTRDEPKLCPDPTAENIKGRSESALRYQEQISGLPRGVSVKLVNPVTGKLVDFDGCRKEDGTMLEGKGPQYEKHMTDSDEWKYYFRGDAGIKDQMVRQSQAAAGRMVEWHFAEERVADYYREWAAGKHLANIIVIYTPAEYNGR